MGVPIEGGMESAIGGEQGGVEVASGKDGQRDDDHVTRQDSSAILSLAQTGHNDVPVFDEIPKAGVEPQDGASEFVGQSTQALGAASEQSQAQPPRQSAASPHAASVHAETPARADAFNSASITSDSPALATKGMPSGHKNAYAKLHQRRGDACAENLIVDLDAIQNAAREVRGAARDEDCQAQRASLLKLCQHAWGLKKITEGFGASITPCAAGSSDSQKHTAPLAAGFVTVSRPDVSISVSS